MYHFKNKTFNILVVHYIRYDDIFDLNNAVLIKRQTDL